MIKAIKRVAKWYFNQTAKTYFTTPTCVIPIDFMKGI